LYEPIPSGKRAKTPHLYAGVAIPTRPKTPLHAYGVPPRTPRLPNNNTYLKPDNVAWAQFAQEFASTSEFDYGLKPEKLTERWMREQQHVTVEKRMWKADKENWHAWDALASNVDLQARDWMLQEEARRKAASAKEAERARKVREEMRRVEDRIKKQVDEDIARIQEERRRRAAESLQRQRSRAIQSWRNYESGWKDLLGSNAMLDFMSIPWPSFSQVRAPVDLTSTGITDFYFSQYHSNATPRRERLRAAIRLYHPDRFRRLLSRVTLEDREMVEEAVGIVARCINDLMERES
jgi:hypothetical protein